MTEKTGNHCHRKDKDLKRINRKLGKKKRKIRQRGKTAGGKIQQDVKRRKTRNTTTKGGSDGGDMAAKVRHPTLTGRGGRRVMQTQRGDEEETAEKRRERRGLNDQQGDFFRAEPEMELVSVTTLFVEISLFFKNPNSAASQVDCKPFQHSTATYWCEKPLSLH